MPPSAAGTSDFSVLGDATDSGAIAKKQQKMPGVKVSSGAVFNVGDMVRVNVNRRTVKAKIASVDPFIVKVETAKAGWEEVESEGDGLEMDGEDGNKDAFGSATEVDADGLDLPGGVVDFGAGGASSSKGKSSKSGDGSGDADDAPFLGKSSSSSNTIKILPGEHKVLRDVKNQMTKEKFLKFAAPLEMTVGGMRFLAGAREFNSHEENRANAAVNVNVVVYKSHEWPKSMPSWVTFVRGLVSKNPHRAVWLEPSEAKREEDEAALLTLMRTINGTSKKSWSVGAVKSLLQDDDVVAIAKANGKPVPGPRDVDDLFRECETAKRDEQRKSWKPAKWEEMEKAFRTFLLQKQLTPNEKEVRSEWWELIKEEHQAGQQSKGGNSFDILDVAAVGAVEPPELYWSERSEVFMTEEKLAQEKKDCAAEQLAADDEDPELAFERMQLAALQSDVKSGLIKEEDVDSKLDWLKSLPAPAAAEPPQNNQEKKSSSMKRPAPSAIPMKIVKGSKTSDTSLDDADAEFERLQKEMNEKHKKQKRG
eukprot:CAMPEP_0179008422 /NCGR_PEP_ID=MMETSP0795-20121207/15707_1 /TAXON_ID=88552 /ORGANISM="Amoebophrya sp., Strain Ameob2" /LENGTH=535 /DNA_ID=CAMNT_0020703505 /DNA_START=367 /DNA_END=1974 /DNA_ORIENTATION=-